MTLYIRIIAYIYFLCSILRINPPQAPFTTNFWVNYVNASDNRQSRCNRGTRASHSNNHPHDCQLKRKRRGTSLNWCCDINWHGLALRLLLCWCSMMCRIKVGRWIMLEQNISCFKLCMESLSLVNLSNWNELIAPGNLNYLRVPWNWVLSTFNQTSSLWIRVN